MTYPLHPCSIPNLDPAELAAAEEAARREARERIVAAVRERAAEEARVADALAAELALTEEAAAAGDPGAALPEGAPQGAARGGFGRGWIPVERDIGLPSDAFGEGGEESPLLFRGGDLGVVADAKASAAACASGGHHPPAPSSQEEGEKERVWRSIDFTPARRAVFLHHLAHDGNVRTACSRVPISAQAAYLARRRDAVFRAAWDAALVQSREHALQVLANRALDGIREEVWHRGELMGHKVRHDTRLLLAHLGRLDTRCQDARALAHADRFDELLALVAGEDYDERLCHGDGDGILPATRAAHADRAASRAGAISGIDEKAADAAWAKEQKAWAASDRAELLAREAAEDHWDEWGSRVDAVNDALEAGEEPVVQPDPAEAEEPAYEVKSLDGVPPRAARWAEAARRAGRGGAEFSPRTLFGSSTWSAAAAGGITPSGKSSPFGGGGAAQR